mmetsp:Transcript_32071/g.70154  ORF Transcript_32071/g.70154 Transcript_32071/m.70154 type:complete len:336 (+) Transcript_32071:108-1115(+)|eukprot:CAMPEP_0170598240 /NCGR_PEP_ID=MMETSP0224-20130122/16139_1 /TAXON_ID=285029 /ORGANISM="Togula jolla, Strain CCCM 725" /LENGTH=335 /DNA_ID=CAMNT_0010922773 /DNA_START=107 /DNA_END=1114 /DNA_ORIENTATION=+
MALRGKIRLFGLFVITAAVVASAVAVWLYFPRRSSVAVYSQDTAVALARLAGAAYCSPESLEAWNCGQNCIPGVTKVKVCQGSSTRTFIAQWKGHGLVSFEGTHTTSSMVKDLEANKEKAGLPSCASCWVHRGFLDEWHSLRGCVIQTLADIGFAEGSEVRVTGHSLGAAVSVIAMIDLVSSGWKILESYNFGMPRTGGKVFASTFNDLFRGRFFRITHHMDPVPHVPPDILEFMHVGSEVFYDGNVSKGYTLCEHGEDYECAGRYWDIARDLFHLGDHSDYMDVITGSAGCGHLMLGNETNTSHSEAANVSNSSNTAPISNISSEGAAKFSIVI